MSEPTEGGRREIERIMRKAEALGEDPQRVARALRPFDREPAELQAVQEVERPSWLSRLLAKGSTADSRPRERQSPASRSSEFHGEGGLPFTDPAPTEAISAAMVELYAETYGHDRTTATTYINDNVVVCVLEGILTKHEDAQIARGHRGAVIDGRVAFQTDTEDEFTAAIERLTHRKVVAFMSANQTTPGVACELFFLEAAPLSSTNGGS